MRKKTSKTHVFPYKALEPFVIILPNGDLQVKPYIGALEPGLAEDVSRLSSNPRDEELFNKILKEIERLRETIEERVLGGLPTPPSEDLINLVGERVRREVIEALRERGTPENEEYLKRVSSIEDLIKTMKPEISSIRQTVRLIEDVGRRSEEKLDKIERMVVTMNISPNTPPDMGYGKEFQDKMTEALSKMDARLSDISNRISQVGDVDRIKEIISGMNLVGEIRKVLDGDQEILGRITGLDSRVDDLRTELEKVVGLSREMNGDEIKRIISELSGIKDIKDGIDNLSSKIGSIGGNSNEELKTEMEKIVKLLNEKGSGGDGIERISNMINDLGIEDVREMLKRFGDNTSQMNQDIMKKIDGIKSLKIEDVESLINALSGRVDAGVGEIRSGVERLQTLMQTLDIKGDVRSAIGVVLKEELGDLAPRQDLIMASLDGLKVTGDDILRRLTREALSDLIGPYMDDIREQISNIRLGDGIEKSISELKSIIESSGGVVKPVVVKEMMDVEPGNPQVTQFLREISSLEDVLRNIQPTIESVDQGVRIISEIQDYLKMIPEFGDVKGQLDTIRKSITEHDSNVVRRFDEVIDKINTLDIGEGIRDKLEAILREETMTRSELSGSAREIINILSGVAAKSDVDVLSRMRTDLVNLKTAVDAIDVNDKLPQFQTSLINQLNEMLETNESKIRELLPKVDIVSMVNQHSTGEIERVVGGMTPGVTSREVDEYISEVKRMIEEVSSNIMKIPVEQSAPDLSNIEKSLRDISEGLSVGEAERMKVREVMDELSRIRDDMTTMFTTMYDNLSKQHETQTEILLSRLKTISETGAKGDQIADLITRFNGMEQYLRTMSQAPPEKKMDEIEETVDKCEKLDEMQRMMNEIFSELNVNDSDSAKIRIRELIKGTQVKKQVSVYTSSPNLKDILSFDAGKMEIYRRQEANRFVELGIQVFSLRTRYTKLIHNSVFIRDKLTALANTPRIYENINDIETGVEIKDEMVLLQDAFSPVYVPDADSNDMIIASIFQRVTPLESVVGMVTSGKKTIGTELISILRRRGNDVRDGYHMYSVDELFDVVFYLINNAREFVRTSPSKESLVEGTPPRYALVNAFVDALADSITNVKTLSDTHGTVDTQVKLPGHVISYVKIRADGNDMDTRYSVNLDRESEKMLLAHEPYVTSSLSVKRLMNHYQYDVYGPHTRIFTPKQGNEDMSSNMREMVEEIDGGKNIMLITFGPSGSGKTSTILYFRDEKEPGVLPRLLSQISSEKYSKASLVGYELAANYDKDGKVYWSHYDVFDTPVKMSRDATNQWIVSSTSKNKILDYSVSGICEISDPYSRIERKPTQVDSGKTIGDLMAQIVDMRLNCGTKNNPFSSRTHLFIFFKIENGPNIVVGDLAGRENTFDCTSYETLLNIVSNKTYYPNLYKEISNVDEISNRTMIRPKTKEDTRPEMVDDFESAVRMATWLNLGGDFKYPLASYGYFLTDMEKTPKDTTLNMRFYDNLAKLLSYLGDFYKDLSRRLENTSAELPPVQNKLEAMKKYTPAQLEIVSKLMRFFQDKFSKPVSNFYIMSFSERFNQYYKTSTSDFNLAFKLIPKMVEYLLTIKFIEETVMRGKARDACRIRNLEGVFINRSLDEITEFARMLVLSGSDSQGPPVHESCLPISCGFAGMDCLIPKKNLKGDVKSVLLELFERVKIKIEPENTSLCLMTVLNLTTPSRYKVPYVYRPVEDLLERIHAAYLEKERLRDTYFEKLQTVNFGLVEGKVSMILTHMTREESLKDEYRKRKEYRGSNEEYMLKDSDLQRLYESSLQNWTDIKGLGEEIIGALSVMYSHDPRLDDIMEKTVKPAINRYHALNTETIPGTLKTCEYIMKASDHLLCSSGDIDNIIRSNDTWKTRPSKIGQTTQPPKPKKTTTTKG